MIHAHLYAPQSQGHGAQFFPCKNLSPSILGPWWPTFLSFGGSQISVFSGNPLHSHVTDPVVKKSEE